MLIIFMIRWISLTHLIAGSLCGFCYASCYLCRLFSIRQYMLLIDLKELGFFSNFHFFFKFSFFSNFHFFHFFQFFRKMYGCEANSTFALKCIMKNSPLYLVCALLIMTIIVFGHALRICERYSANTQNFGYYWNCMWLVILTMTTGTKNH